MAESNVPSLFSSNLGKQLQGIKSTLSQYSGIQLEGRLTRLIGLTVEAIGCQEPIGSRCWVTSSQNERVEAEVVGFSGNKTFLMCTGSTQGIAPGAGIIPTGRAADVAVGERLLGRVLDGSGNPIDGKGNIITTAHYPLMSQPINPLQRASIDTPLDVGVRAINALLTVGRGQRMGLFAGSGVGKSILLSMMTRFTTADVIVVGLIGERGREVKEFIELNLGEEGLRRAVIVAAPADQSSLMRLHGAMVATSIAEFFRDQGKHVLLLMDSLTRFAQAQREIALSIGEPPATKGYPPSVFAKLPQLVERAGNGDSGSGSITAFYTVLTEGDDQQDPIADASRAILDGHIVLDRELAESGHFPAIDIESSVSRVMPSITHEHHQQWGLQFKHWVSIHKQNRDLINVGAYAKGSNLELDQAIQMYDLLMAFLRQGMHEEINFQQSLAQLEQLFSTLT